MSGEQIRPAFFAGEEQAKKSESPTWIRNSDPAISRRHSPLLR